MFWWSGYSRAMVNHQTYTTEQVTVKMDELFKEAIAAKLTATKAEEEAQAKAKLLWLLWC